MMNFNFFNAFMQNRHQAVDDLFNAGEVTLEKVLDTEEVITAMKSGNSQLVEFFTNEDILYESLDYIVVEPTVEDSLPRQRKFPFVVCELLSVDNSDVLDLFFSSEKLLEKLLSFVRSGETLNYTLAGYVNRIWTALFARQPIVLFKYLETNGYIPCLVAHVYCNAFAEILSKMIRLQEKEDENYSELLKSRIFILEDLVSLIHSETSFEKIQGARSVIMDLFVHYATVESWNTLANSIVSQDNLTTLMKWLCGDNIDQIKSSAIIIAEIVGHAQFNDFAYAEFSENDVPEESDQPLIFGFLEKHFSTFDQILQQDNKIDSHVNTVGQTVQPLGEHRIKIVEIVDSMIKTCNEDLMSSLAASELIPTVTDLFFQYEWCSAIHKLFDSICSNILTSCNSLLLNQIICRSQLIGRILEASMNSDHTTPSGLRIRKGHMATIVKLSNTLIFSSESSEFIKDACINTTGWDNYVQTTLKEQNEQNCITNWGIQAHSSFLPDDPEEVEEESLSEIHLNSDQAWEAYNAKDLKLKNELFLATNQISECNENKENQTFNDNQFWSVSSLDQDLPDLD